MIGDWIFSWFNIGPSSFPNRNSSCGWAGRISSLWFCFSLWSACKNHLHSILTHILRNCISEVSCSLLFKFITILFMPWEILTHEWKLTLFIDMCLISTPYLPCKQQVVTSNTGTILVFPLIHPFGSDVSSSLGKSVLARSNCTCELWKFCSIFRHEITVRFPSTKTIRILTRSTDIILTSTPYLPCKQQVATSNTGPNFGVPLDPSLSVQMLLRLLAKCTHDRPLHLWIVRILQCLLSWNVVRFQQHLGILHPYKIYSICLVVTTFQFVSDIFAIEDLCEHDHHFPMARLSWSRLARMRNSTALPQRVSPFDREGFRILHTFPATAP